MAWLNSRRIKKLIRNFSVNFGFQNKENHENENNYTPYLLPVETQVKKISKVNKKVNIIKNKNNYNLSNVFGFHRYLIHKLKHFSFNFKLKSLRPVLASLLIIILIVQIFTPNPRDVVYGATYTFTQTNWTVADTTTGTPNDNYPAHSAGQSGWVKYFSKDSGVSIVSENIQLTQNISSWTQTSAADFNAGSSTNVYVSSTGNSFILLKPAGANCSASYQCASGSCLYGSCKIATGDPCPTLQDSSCAGGFCESGTCRVINGGACTVTANCVAGSTCVNSLCLSTYTLTQTTNAATTPQPPSNLTGGFNNRSNSTSTAIIAGTGNAAYVGLYYDYIMNFVDWANSWGMTMYQPHGVAVDDSGNIYVSENGNHRIQKLNSSGVWQTNFGTSGTGNDQLNFPLGIEFKNGSIFIADSWNNRVKEINTSGVFQGSYGSYGSANGQLNAPSSATSDGYGTVYVADRGNNRIQKYDYMTGWQWTLGGIASGSGNGQFSGPYGIKLGNDGYIYVSDTGNSRIQKISPAGGWLATYGSYGTGSGQFNQPYGITLDSSGNIYVADYANNRVQILNSSGVFVRGIGGGTTWTGTAPAPTSGNGNGYFFLSNGSCS